MLVTIVVVPNADNTGLDPDRMGKVENIPDEVAVKMLQMGTAREPAADELDTYRKAQAADVDGKRPGDQAVDGVPESATTVSQPQVKRPAMKTATGPDSTDSGTTDQPA